MKEAFDFRCVFDYEYSLQDSDYGNIANEDDAIEEANNDIFAKLEKTLLSDEVVEKIENDLDVKIVETRSEHSDESVYYVFECEETEKEAIAKRLQAIVEDIAYNICGESEIIEYSSDHWDYYNDCHYTEDSEGGWVMAVVNTVIVEVDDV